MSAREIADHADMIVAGYAFTVKEDYIEVTDLNDLNKRAVIQNGDLVESVMEDMDDELVMLYYNRNREILEETVYA